MRLSESKISIDELVEGKRELDETIKSAILNFVGRFDITEMDVKIYTSGPLGLPVTDVVVASKVSI